MDADEIIITRASNGWLIRASKVNRGDYIPIAEMAVSATVAHLGNWVEHWAERQTKKENAQ
jgi:hypothetical protein